MSNRKAEHMMKNEDSNVTFIEVMSGVLKWPSLILATESLIGVIMTDLGRPGRFRYYILCIVLL